MFSKNGMQFQHKIYSITATIILLFIIGSVVSYTNTLNISKNIESLKKTNEELQKNLIFLSDIEKVKRYILEYSITGDEVFVEPIEELFTGFKNLNKSSVKISKEYDRNYEKLIENIERYNENFYIAKEQIPRNFLLRKNLRNSAQKIEDKINLIKDRVKDSEDLFDLILFRKVLLEIEKGSVRYFETDNINYVVRVKKEFLNAKSLLSKLSTSESFKKKNVMNEISLALESFEELVGQTIQHYRTYSMLTKVVMPGDVYEVYHYSNVLKKMTFEEIELTRLKLENYIELNKDLNLIIGIVFVVLILLSFLFIIRIILGPIKELTQMFEQLSTGDVEIKIPEYKHNDEIGKLISAANHYKQVNIKTKELLKQTQDYQENLEKKVQEEIAIRREREKALVQQSKLASMGEMIGAIAHQWRQPLNELSIRIQKLKYSYAKGEMDEEFILSFIDKNKKTIDFMSKTIDDFRNFFRIDKEMKNFLIKEALKEVLNIQSAQLKNHNIIVNLEGDEFTFKGFKTEFQQVIINLIGNAKDAFVKNNTQDPKIDISIDANGVYIQDNAGGIPEEILERVFEPYFTTKEQGEGTGMGLYMSKMIIEDNMHSKIKISNKDDGVLISINLKANKV